VPHSRVEERPMSHGQETIFVMLIIGLGYELDAIRRYTKECLHELEEIQKGLRAK
jgi:hypothetical protein